MITIRGITPILSISVLLRTEIRKVVINLLSSWHQLDQHHGTVLTFKVSQPAFYSGQLGGHRLENLRLGIELFQMIYKMKMCCSQELLEFMYAEDPEHEHVVSWLDSRGYP